MIRIKLILKLSLLIFVTLLSSCSQSDNVASSNYYNRTAKQLYPDKGLRQLTVAAGKGNIAGFRRLLELGANPNHLYDGEPFAANVVAHYSSEYVELLHGLDPNLSRDDNNCTIPVQLLDDYLIAVL